LQRAVLLLATLVAVVGLAKALTPTLEAGVAWLGAATTPKTVRRCAMPEARPRR
jgi:hypothetical protein